MNVTISGAVSAFSVPTLSPPFDEVDRRTMDYARSVAEQLDSEEPAIAYEVAIGLARLLEAREHFYNAARMHIQVMKGVILEEPPSPAPVAQVEEEEPEEPKEPVVRQTPARTKRANN